MSNIYQLVPPSELTEIARYILTTEDQEMRLAATDNQRITSFAPWFDMVFEDAIEVEWKEDLNTPYTPSAPFRSFDTPVPEGSLPGGTIKRAGMIPTGLGFTMGELAMLLQRVRQGGDERELMLAATDEQVRRGVIAAMNRMHLAMSDLVVGGSLTVAENGVQSTVSVGRAAQNDATAGTAWSDTANADPHGDEQALIDRLEDVYGLAWDDLVVVTDKATYNQYTGLDAVRSDIPTFRVQTGDASRNQINELRANRELPPVLILNRSIQNPNGVLTKLCPSNNWVIMPRPGISVGKMVWGAPASLDLEGVSVAAGSGNGGPVALIETNGTVPPRRRTVVDALGMPYVQAPNWTARLNTNGGL